MGMTLQEAARHVTSTDPRFAVGTASIRGVTYRVFENAPPNMRALLRESTTAQEAMGGDYLVYQDERWTYAEYCADIRAMAAVLQNDLGVRPGDRVALAMRNFPEFLVLIMAIAAVGAVTVFVNAWWTAEELRYGFADSGAKIAFADGLRHERIATFAKEQGIRLVGVRDAESEAALQYGALLQSRQGADWPEVEIAADDDFAIMYSSGTTGHPKGVVQTHRGAISAVMAWMMAGIMAPMMESGLLNAETPDTPPPRPANLVVTPLFHVTATHPVFLLSIPTGMKVVLLHKWDPDAAVEIIEREKITRFIGVPTQTAELMDAAQKHGTSLPSLNFVGSGGAKRPAAQVGELSRAFPQAAVASGWGMTETNAVGLNIAGADYVTRPEAGGQLLPPLQDMKILDGAGNEVPLGQIGELTVKSPSNMRCYLNKPEATAEVMQDGWLRTGDLATCDAEGYVQFVDRKKNIIIRGGENIACLDVEGALHRHPAIAEAGVFPVPDARLGEVVGAGIMVRPGAALDCAELSTFLSEQLAPFKIPEHYWLREDPLPRGATEKIDRRALRAECITRPDATGRLPTQD